MTNKINTEIDVLMKLKGISGYSITGTENPCRPFKYITGYMENPCRPFKYITGYMEYKNKLLQFTGTPQISRHRAKKELLADMKEDFSTIKRMNKL